LKFLTMHELSIFESATNFVEPVLVIRQIKNLLKSINSIESD
jgi:hypothetical protein